MFADLFKNVWGTFVTVVGGLAEGVKSAFSSLVYKVTTDTGAEGIDILVDSTEMSPLVRFLFAIGGFGLAIGIIYGIFRLIRGVASR